MLPICAYFPDFTFTVQHIIIPALDPFGHVHQVPGLRIIACCKQSRDLFVVETDDAAAGLAALLDQLAEHRAGG